jgi:hypothetical protein
MKRLVKLNPISKRFIEVDRVKLERVARDLLDFIQNNISPNNDPFDIWKWVVPLCEGVLNNTLKLPLPYDQLPLKYPMREGLLPDALEKIYAPFSNTITGTPIVKTEKIESNGALYVEVDFEDRTIFCEKIGIDD